MLVLTRTVGDTIVLSNGVRIKLLSTNGAVARIGIDAPDDVRIDCGEAYRRREQAG